MKVLYSCLSNGWGEMEEYTISALQQMVKKHINIEFLCIKESRLHVEASNMGIIIYPINKPGYFSPLPILKTIALLRRGNYDLIHSQLSKDLWTIVPALKIVKYKIPLFLSKNSSSAILKKDFLHKWIYDRLNFIFAANKLVKDNLLETTPIEEKKIILICNENDDEFKSEFELLITASMKNKFEKKPLNNFKNNFDFEITNKLIEIYCKSVTNSL